MGCRARLKGTRVQLDSAKVLINNLMDPAIGADGQPAAHMETQEIPRGSVGRLIGAGGARIQEMQQQSGAKIDIDRSQPDRVLVRFAGHLEAINNAKFLVQEILAGRDRSVTGDTAITMEVPASTTGRLIGPAGRQINDLQERSGAKIDVDKSRDPAIVRIAGSGDAVALAQNMVREVIAQPPGAPPFPPAFPMQAPGFLQPSPSPIMPSVVRPLVPHVDGRGASCS